jgi:hypothetical protein
MVTEDAAFPYDTYIVVQSTISSTVKFDPIVSGVPSDEIVLLYHAMNQVIMAAKVSHFC